MKRNWEDVVREEKHLQQNIKNMKTLSEFFVNLPEEGYMFDNISKRKIAIKDCADSTLRRYTKLLGKYYSLVRKPEERAAVVAKLTEIKAELKLREPKQQ